MVKYGIIGLGNMGTGHIGNFMTGKVPGATVTAIADVKKDRVERIQSKYPDVNFEKYYSASDLINNADVDAVLVAVPHYDHPSIVIEALKKGLTLFAKSLPAFTLNKLKK